MFNQAVMHRPMVGQRFDIGLLAETMIFFDQTILLLDRASMYAALDQISPALLVRLMKDYGLQISYHREYSGVITSNNLGVETHRLSMFRIGGTKDKPFKNDKDEVEQIIDAKGGKGRQNRKSAHRLLSRIACTKPQKLEVKR